MSTPEHINVNDTRNGNQAPEAEQQVNYEKRFKDTQAAFTKSQQELKAAKAKLDALEKLAQPTIELDDSVKQELEDLKYSDPDAWRKRMNTLEQDARVKHQELLNEAAMQASTQAELERRASLLAQYNASHPGAPITDELIALDVPSRITKKLEKGEIDFETFLREVHEFIYSPKKVGSGNTVLAQPNLGSIGGGTSPSSNAVIGDIAKNYKDIIF